MSDLKRRCVALLSGGLDSTLAAKLMLLQGIEVEGLNFRTFFECCRNQAHKAAQELGVPLTVLGMGDDYLDMIAQPRFGYGRGVNPCLDCRIHMFRLARQFMEKVGASFVVSGEVIGQRPMSQKQGDLVIVARESGLADRLLRPLSALRLPPTWPEREGIVDRRRLLGHVGRGRGPLLDLARQLGLKHTPSASAGCLLTQKPFTHAFRDLVASVERPTAWDYELLKQGRQIRLDPQAKVVLGRNEQENLRLAALHTAKEARPNAFVHPLNFKGPDALLVAEPTDDRLHKIAQLILKWSKRYDPMHAEFEVTWAGARSTFVAAKGPVPEYVDLFLPAVKG